MFFTSLTLSTLGFFGAVDCHTAWLTCTLRPASARLNQQCTCRPARRNAYPERGLLVLHVRGPVLISKVERKFSINHIVDVPESHCCLGITRGGGGGRTPKLCSLASSNVSV